MTDDSLQDSHIAEAANAAANAEEARQKAFKATSQSQREETKDIFVHAMREVLTEGDEGTKTLLLQKIPLLCIDMLVMKGDVREIKTNLKWVMWLVMGGVAGVCGIAVMLLIK
jgi:hypothetical protein